MRLHEGGGPLDDGLVGGDRTVGVASIQVHGTEVGARARVVRLQRQVAYEQGDRLLVLLVVVVDVGRATQRVGVLGVDLERVLEGGERVGGVGGVELRCPVFHLPEPRPHVHVLGLLLGLRRQVGDEGLHLRRECERDRRMPLGQLPSRRRGLGRGRVRPARCPALGRNQDQRPDGEACAQKDAQNRGARHGESPARCPGRTAAERPAALRAEL